MTKSARRPHLLLTGRNLTLRSVCSFAESGGRVALSKEALHRVRRSKAITHTELHRRTIYGINTGFGPMSNRRIETADIQELQRNLVVSHACGAGEPVSPTFVRAAMIVRLNTLARGNSGVSPELLLALAEHINHNITPVVPRHGGVGASGDLIQLAHIAVGLLGEGNIFTAEGECRSARSALKRAGLSPYLLKPKEGLALINGTSFMAGVACIVVSEAEQLVCVALRNAALALEIAGAFDDAIDPTLQAMRPHRGQQEVATYLRTLTKGSSLLRRREQFERHAPLGEDAQDVYSLRCVPQILGPVFESLQNTKRIITIEINAATDNPLVDPNKKRFLHGGNFHGEYVGKAMDDLKISLAKLAMLSERRTNYFLNPSLNKKFPPFLNRQTPGLTLGLQGLQFTATSAAAVCQTLATPHSIHSISTNQDNQDVVSMGADAALFATELLKTAFVVVAIESIALAQAVDLLPSGTTLSKEARKLLKAIRSEVRPLKVDRSLSGELGHLIARLKNDRTLGGLLQEMV